MDPYRIQPVEIQPFNLPNALATHYKLNEMQRSENAQNALADNAPAIFGNDPAAQQTAIKNVAAVDPNSAIQLQRAISQMNGDQLKVTQQRLDLGGQIAGSLVSGNIPDNELAAATLKWGIPRAEQLGINVDDIKQAAIAASSTGNVAPLKQLLAQKRDSALTASQQVQAAQSSRDFQYKQGRDAVEDNFKTRQMAETARHNRVSEANSANSATAIDLGATTVDPNSGSILAQTGLSMPGFLVLTGKSSSLPRDKNTRDAAFREASSFANRTGTDVSTFASRYEAANNALKANVMRNNQMGILEGELTGTIDNLKPLADAAGLGKVNVGNIGKLFLGKQVNDPNVQQYRFQLKQLQSEIAGYLAAARGNIDQNGNVRTDDSDMHDAADVITNGLNSGGAAGLQQAIDQTTEKARAVLDNSVRVANKQVWGLFGLADNYERLHPRKDAQPSSTSSNPATNDPLGIR